MNTPTIKFTNTSLNKEIDWLYGFLFKNNWGWKKYIIKKHPKIKNTYNLKTERKRKEYLKKYILTFKKENKKNIEENKLLFEKKWKKMEDTFFKTLAEIMKINWPKNKKIIKAMISINPICPRFLKNWSFFIFYNYKEKDVMEIIMHECCHFLYFEKWKKMYPKTNPKKFEHPYLEWHLSEIIAPIILNDSKIQKLLKQKAVFYEEHSKLKIKNKSIPIFFTELYKKNNFESFLNKSYKIIKENKILFKKL